MSAPDHDAHSDDELDPDEPRTPLWLPLLGLCLFVSALVYVLVGQKPAPERAPEPPASASAAPAPPPAPAPNPE
jgi:hypothetical protein